MLFRSGSFDSMARTTVPEATVMARCSRRSLAPSLCELCTSGQLLRATGSVSWPLSAAPISCVYSYLPAGFSAQFCRKRLLRFNGSTIHSLSRCYCSTVLLTLTRSDSACSCSCLSHSCPLATLQAKPRMFAQEICPFDWLTNWLDVRSPGLSDGH